jgi:protein phosphatase
MAPTNHVFSDPHPFPPWSSKVWVEFGAESRKGKPREVNDDHYLIVQVGRYQETMMTSLPEASIPHRFDEYGYGMFVADGVSGTAASESASRLALVSLLQLFLHFGKWNVRIDDKIAQEIMERAERFYRHVDGTVVYHGLQGPEGGMQTTLTSVFGAGRDLFFAHVGHSRAYLFRSGQLMRLTTDHTVGGQRKSRVPAAPLVDVNAAARDLKHILTETIGMRGPAGPMIDLEHFTIENNDKILVCTNGLTDMVDEDLVAGVLESREPPELQSKTLVDAAMEAGGEDDATVLIAHYHIPE